MGLLGLIEVRILSVSRCMSIYVHMTAVVHPAVKQTVVGEIGFEAKLYFA